MFLRTSSHTLHSSGVSRTAVKKLDLYSEHTSSYQCSKKWCLQSNHHYSEDLLHSPYWSNFFFFSSPRAVQCVWVLLLRGFRKIFQNRKHLGKSSMRGFQNKPQNLQHHLKTMNGGMNPFWGQLGDNSTVGHDSEGVESPAAGPSECPYTSHHRRGSSWSSLLWRWLLAASCGDI